MKVNLVSGSSISISWVAVEGASSYTIDIQPTPTMSNKLTVSTDYAFIDGLLAGQEYTIRVAATVNNVQSAYSSELKVTPSGAPIIAPAPRVLSFDESSVTLGRRHMHHYRNGHDLSKVIVEVLEEGGSSHELEFAVPSFLFAYVQYKLPLKITGLSLGKTYSFAWRFGNSKGVQETYSRFSVPVTIKQSSTFCFLSFTQPSPTLPSTSTSVWIAICSSCVGATSKPPASPFSSLTSASPT